MEDGRAAQGHVQPDGRQPKKTRKLKIAEAMKLLVDEEAAKLVNEDEIARRPGQREQNGIVFIDEIDKVASRQESSGADVSRQGVQRDLLPLVEARRVHQVRHGQDRPHPVHRLGRLPPAKPSDLIPELQGASRSAWSWTLSVDDFEAILTSTHASLVKQYQALLATEGVSWSFSPTAFAAWRRSPTRSTSAPRTSARAAWPR
jgi:ATP-dependent HslUV protease ATP-binding subunit HslU